VRSAFRAALFVASSAFLSLFLSCPLRTGEPPSARVCASKPVLQGVDVSSHQRAIAWGAVRDAGVAFTFIRVSDGADVADAAFDTNWSGAKAAGILRGAYQFFRPSQDPIAQADVVVDALAPDPGELPVVLDFEVTEGQPATVTVARARPWLARVESATGRTPIVYTTPSMGSVLRGNLATYPLWVANYGAMCPAIPSGWSDWLFWQRSATGSIDGIGAPVDLDEFQGTPADLVALAHASGAPVNAP
jgi:lysozyme